MPLIRVISSAAPSDAASDALLRDLSTLLARELSKPESYVMTCLEPRARMTFGGSDQPTCYIEVKNVGTFTPSKTAQLSRAITERVAKGLGVAVNRIYIEFADASPHLWGYGGHTFA